MTIPNTELINRVAQSDLITFNLEDFFPTNPIAEFDIQKYLFMGLILKEKDFRQSLKDYDWTIHLNQHLVVFCSTDAIIPTWAYMLVAQYAQDHATSIFQGTKEDFLRSYYAQILEKMDLSHLKDKKVVIKGCSNKPVPANAYTVLTFRLKNIAASIMYGEPCSTVPIFKKAKE